MTLIYGAVQQENVCVLKFDWNIGYIKGDKTKTGPAGPVF
jgi:hypothetical protein